MNYRKAACCGSVHLQQAAQGEMQAERQQAEYCEMVKLWKQTKGQAGWPAFNGEKMCK